MLEQKKIPAELFLVETDGVYRVFTHGPAAKAWRTQQRLYHGRESLIYKSTIGEWEEWG